MLAGIASQTGIDFRECPCLIGTSAGSIVSAHLAAGEEPRSPIDPGDEDMPAPDNQIRQEGRVNGMPLAAMARRAGSLGMAAGAPLAPFALAAAAPGGALARAALLTRTPAGRFDLDGLGDRLDALGGRVAGPLR